MGLLDMGGYGFAEGFAQEYLKQGDETRQEERDVRGDERTAMYQEMRDKRLAGINKDTASALAKTNLERDQAGYKAEAAEGVLRRTSAENIADSRSGANRPVTLGPQEQLYAPEGGEMLAENPNIRSTSALKPNEQGFKLLGSDRMATLNELNEMYDNDAWIEDTDALGNKSRRRDPNFKFQSRIDYINSRVAPENRIDIYDPTTIPPDPDLLFESMKENMKDFDEARATAIIQKRFPDWKGPGGNVAEQAAESADKTDQAPDAIEEPYESPTSKARKNEPTPAVVSQQATPNDRAGILAEGSTKDTSTPTDNWKKETSPDAFSAGFRNQLKEVEQQIKDLDKKPSGRTGRAGRSKLVAKRDRLRRILESGS